MPRKRTAAKLPQPELEDKEEGSSSNSDRETTPEGRETPDDREDSVMTDSNMDNQIAAIMQGMQLEQEADSDSGSELEYEESEDYIESDGAIAQIWKPLDRGCFDPAAAMQGLGFKTSLKGLPFCSGYGGRQAVMVTSSGYVIEAAIIEPGYQGVDTYQLL
ncbi:hypothetical protein BGZ82_001359 [Podila clonocystis]|nr:hypothetical protein BGZ82_001359 [Podila clonocystis]